MKHMHRHTLKLIAGLCMAGFILLLQGCGAKDDTRAATDPLPAADNADLFSTTPLANAVDVAQAKRSAQPGDSVVLRGQIGGVQQPFLEGYAGFVLADEQVLFCNEMGMEDGCPTPWDACCEDTDTLQASRATVQFLNTDGTPLPVTLKGQNGLKELQTVLVSGIVAEQSTPQNLIINATRLYPVPNKVK